MKYKTKTSIYIDKEVWEKFKLTASKKGMEASKMLEEIMRDEMAEDFLEQALRDLKDYEGREIDFEPVEPEGGPVSELIRVMRDERNSSVS
ncbi:MAG: CopG family transcriptional regulator [Thermoproteota archaeon]|nr:CopG family transcriptional regulator [Candidatus Brockarchaeota archaeon]